jgi:hypothetical protein
MRVVSVGGWHVGADSAAPTWSGQPHLQDDQEGPKAVIALDFKDSDAKHELQIRET